MHQSIQELCLIVLHDFHNIRIPLHPSRTNLHLAHPPTLPIPHNLTLILIPKQIILLKLRRRPLTTPEMLRQHTTRQPALIALNRTPNIRRAMCGVERSSNSGHEFLNHRVSAADDGVVQPDFVEGCQVHYCVLCDGAGAEFTRAKVKGVDEADERIDGGLAIREAVGVGHGGFALRWWFWFAFCVEKADVYEGRVAKNTEHVFTIICLPTRVLSPSSSPNDLQRVNRGVEFEVVKVLLVRSEDVRITEMVDILQIRMSRPSVLQEARIRTARSPLDRISQFGI
jgi:hypothetical protein